MDCSVSLHKNLFLLVHVYWVVYEIRAFPNTIFDKEEKEMYKTVCTTIMPIGITLVIQEQFNLSSVSFGLLISLCAWLRPPLLQTFSPFYPLSSFLSHFPAFLSEELLRRLSLSVSPSSLSIPPRPASSPPHHTQFPDTFKMWDTSVETYSASINIKQCPYIRSILYLQGKND